jgi:two-component system, NarL family, nitrate/nitrite response regulator NarL
VAGELPMPARLARQVLASSRGMLHRSPAGPPVTFTAREKETLGLLAQGFSNKQIAKSLGISAHGVKRLVGAVLLKLGAPNRTTAVIMAMNEGLV